MGQQRIPDITVKRLTVYLRVLTELREEAVDIVSSAELARRTGFSSEQIRKDLAYFGAFGTRGVGYSSDLLIDRLRHILGLNKGVKVALVGVGNLGTALIRHNLYRLKDVTITAVFDNDRDKVGKKIESLEILGMEDLPRVVREQDIKIAVIAVPGIVAQSVGDYLMASGIKAILNFAPVKLDSRCNVHVKNIDLAIELQSLSYYATGESNRGSTTGA